MYGKTDSNFLDLVLMIPIIFFILLGIYALSLGDFELVLMYFSISGIIYYGRKWQTNKIYLDDKDYKMIHWREEAHRRETALDYPAAIDLWEKLGEIEEAGRVRKLQSDLNSPKMDQTIVQGDQITKTEIKDSVINKSNIGSDKE